MRGLHTIHNNILKLRIKGYKTGSPQFLFYTLLNFLPVPFYFNSRSILKKFPVASTSILKKDITLLRKANLPLESVLYIAEPSSIGLPSLVTFPTA
jgi:hypothetical protein